MTSLTRSELNRAIAQMRTWPNYKEHIAALLRLPSNERDHILLLAAYLDGTPVSGANGSSAVVLDIEAGRAARDEALARVDRAADPDWKALAERLTAAGTEFILAPSVRFEGEPGEQWTMFFRDPSGNPIEIKGFSRMEDVFSK